MLETNIDRLHKVINGESEGRGVGSTTAIFHNVAGYVLNKDIRWVIIKVPNYSVVHKTYIYILLDIIKEYGIKVFKKSHNFFMANNTIVRFCTLNELDMTLKGKKDYIVVNTDYWPLADSTFDKISGKRDFDYYERHALAHSTNLKNIVPTPLEYFI